MSTNTASGQEGLLHKGRPRVIGGVCSGIAQHMRVDVTLVRIAFVALALASGAGIVVYVLLWILMPEADAAGAAGSDVIANGLRSVGSDLGRIGDQLKRPAAR